MCLCIHAVPYVRTHRAARAHTDLRANEQAQKQTFIHVLFIHTYVQNSVSVHCIHYIHQAHQRHNHTTDTTYVPDEINRTDMTVITYIPCIPYTT